MLSLTLLGLLLPVNESKARAPNATQPTPDLAVVAAQIIDRTNEFRREQGRPPVTAHAELESTARYFAEFMAQSDTFGHTADGASPADRAKAHGYQACAIAENIAYYYSTAGFTTPALTQQFIQGWQRSPAHRTNMLDTTVTEIGVALAQSPQTGYYYAVQLFGQPISARIQFEISNESTAIVQYASGSQTWRLAPGYIQTHQQCRPVELIFDWPGQQANTRIQPKPDGRYAIMQDRAGAFNVKPR
jgi:uncharacterized protein YkwD